MQQEQNGISYYNTGAWVDERPTYIVINEEGVKIHEYERTDDRDSSEERSETDSAFAELAGEPGLLEDAEYEGVGS
jgi:hypothetical protein